LLFYDAKKTRNIIIKLTHEGDMSRDYHFVPGEANLGTSGMGNVGKEQQIATSYVDSTQPVG